MKSNLFLRVISVLVTILFFGQAQAAALTPSQAQGWAEENGRLLLETFREKDAKKRYKDLDKLLLEYVDLEYISQFVVGKYWRTMSAEQQAEYRQIFKRYALALYKTFPLDFVDGLSYEVGQAYKDGKFVVVPATVHVALGGDRPQDILLQFRLHNIQTGIKLVDIKLAESSLILSYRSKFYEIIAADDGEMSWFLEDLEAMAVSAERNNQLYLGRE